MSQPGPGPEKTALVFYCDEGASLLKGISEEEYPGAAKALQTFLELVREYLDVLCRLPEYRHVKLAELAEGAFGGPSALESTIFLRLGTPQLQPNGSLRAVTELREPLDIQGLLTARAGLPPAVQAILGLDEEGTMVLADDKVAAHVEQVNNRLKILEAFERAVAEEAEDALVGALQALAPGDSELVPIQPSELLLYVLPAYMYLLAGHSPPLPNPLQRGLGALGGLLGHGTRCLRGLGQGLGRRVGALRKAVWRVEDVAVAGGKMALRLGRRAVRPVLIGFVLSRVLRTIEAGQSPFVKMAKLPADKQMDFYYRRLLGDNWREQMKEDMLQAIKEVDEGLGTDEYKDEKRLLTAAMLRQLEVEEWDKERMRHFYYGSYGMGPWYFDMEERLHNPFFVGARAWNDPPENWVGRNKASKDGPVMDPVERSLDLIEARRGVRLTPEQRAKLRAREALRPAECVMANQDSLPFLRMAGKLDEKEVAEKLAA